MNVVRLNATFPIYRVTDANKHYYLCGYDVVKFRAMLYNITRAIEKRTSVRVPVIGSVDNGDLFILSRLDRVVYKHPRLVNDDDD